MKVIIGEPVKCCSKTTKYVFRLDSPITIETLTTFVMLGFFAPKSFTDIGHFYVYIDGLVATTAFGNDWLHVICDDENLVQKFANDLSRTTE